MGLALTLTLTLTQVLILSTSKSYIFVIFFKQFFGICLFGALHGLLLLPVLLSLIGPDPVDVGARTDRSLDGQAIKPNGQANGQANGHALEMSSKHAA